MNKELQTTPTKQEKRKTNGETFKDDSMHLETLYISHYTRYGRKKTFFFALRQVGIIESPLGKASKPHETVSKYFKYSHDTKTYRMDMNQRKNFGDVYKDIIRQYMLCIEAHLATIATQYHEDVETYYIETGNKSEARDLANALLQSRKKRIFNEHKTPCRGALNETNSEDNREENNCTDVTDEQRIIAGGRR